MPAAGLATFLATAALSAFGFPLGLPPGAEDPILHRIAPAEPLVFLSWSESIAPQASSANRLDQLLSDPEIARSAAAIDAVLGKAMDGALARMPKGQADVLRKIYGLSKSLVRQPGTVFVQAMPGAPNADPDIRIGMLWKMGPHAASVQQLNDELSATAPPGQIAMVDLAGRKFRRIAGPNPKEVITWGMLGPYLAVGVGPDVVEEIFKRASQAPPRWLTDAQARAPMAKRASILVVNLKAGMALLPPLPETERKQLESFGLDKLASLESITGVDGESVVSRTLLRPEGTPTGVLAVPAGPGIQSADFANMPAGAQHCIAFRVDGPKAIQAIISAMNPPPPPNGPGQLPPRGPDFTKLDQLIGMSAERDLIPAFGVKGLLWVGRAATPITPPPAMISIELKDRPKVAQALDRIVQLVSMNPLIKINKQTLGGVDVFTWQPPQPGVPAISWGVLADRIVIATKASMIGDQAKKPADFKSLADTPELTRALGESRAASVVIYEDPREVYRLLYAGAGIGLTFAGEAIPPDLAGDINLDLLPDPELISKHLRPDITTLSFTSNGLEVHTRASAALLNSTHWVMPAMAMMLGARGGAAPHSKRLVSTNNLKQIALGMHNYHSTMQKLPPAYTVDKNGKPLHSWRTLILPYMEQAVLYDRIKLDEPWNSEHNLKLFKNHIVGVYNSPGTGPPSTKTTYQTIRAATSMFPGDKTVRLDDVIDGTTNSIMVVETHSSKAVEWYMPDDYVPAAADPAAGLRGVWPGLILAAMGDGSVRSLSDRMTPDLFQRLAAIADRKVIKPEELGDQPPRAAPPRGFELPGRPPQHDPPVPKKALQPAR